MSYSDTCNDFAYVENLTIGANDSGGNGTEITDCKGGFFVVGSYNGDNHAEAYGVYYNPTTGVLTYSSLTSGQPLYFYKGSGNDIIMHSMDNRVFNCTVYRFFG